MKGKLLTLLLTCISFFSSGQSLTLSPQAQLSVFTCGRGDQLYSTFGHTAIRVKDTVQQVDMVYNYGAFDFRTDNFYLKFVKGDLQYFVNLTSYDDFLYEYQYDKREVVEQILNLSQSQKQALFDALNTTLEPQNRFYTYKFIDRNCTTIVADKINAVLGSKKVVKTDDTQCSYREVLYPYFEDYFWYKLGINIIFGWRTDEKAEQLFLPVELMHSLEKTKYNGKPIVQKTILVNQGAPVLSKPFSFLNSIWVVLLVVVVLVFSKNTTLYNLYCIIAGLLGVFLCAVGLYSEHREVLWNYNALLFNPLLLFIPFVGKQVKQKLLLILWVLLGLYVILVVTKPYVMLVLPFILAHLLLFYFMWRKIHLLPSVK